MLASEYITIMYIKNVIEVAVIFKGDSYTDEADLSMLKHFLSYNTGNFFLLRHSEASSMAVSLEAPDKKKIHILEWVNIDH